MSDETDIAAAYERRQRRDGIAVAEDQRLRLENPEMDDMARTQAVVRALLKAGFTAEETGPEYYTSAEYFASIRGQKKAEQANARRFDGVAYLKGQAQ